MRAVDRREQLLDVAERVVARDGAAVSMEAIAAEAGVAKAMLYRHFTDKAGLYAALAERHIQQVLAATRTALAGDGTTRERTRNAFDAYLAHVEQHAIGYRLLTRAAQREAVEASRVIADFTERMGDELADNIAVDFALEHDPAARALALTWAHALVGMVTAAADVWLDRGHVTRAELVIQLTELISGTYATLGEAFDRRRTQDPSLRPAIPPPPTAI